MSCPHEVLKSRYYISDDGTKTCKFCVGVKEGERHMNLCPYEALAMMARMHKRRGDELAKYEDPDGEPLKNKALHGEIKNLRNKIVEMETDNDILRSHIKTISLVGGRI